MLARPKGGWEPLITEAAGITTLTERATPWVHTAGLYLDELVEWNRRTDLTAARTVEELVDLTIADASVLAKASPGDASWVDVGSGAGAPGLVLAMMTSGVRMTLVEPRDRRVAFLRSVIGKFRLPRAIVERGRSDRLPERAWDIAVSRATLGPADWLREGARLAKRSVWVLLARDEPPALDGVTAELDLAYEWPLTRVPRRAVRYTLAEPSGV